MKKIIFLATVVLSMISSQAFSASDLEANSLIKCEEAATVDAAVAGLNGTLASPFFNTAAGFPGGGYYKIQNYVSSQPTITKLDNGRISVCVTLTRKGWLASK